MANKKLFDVLDGIVESGYEAETLASVDAVQNYADALGMSINSDMAEAIIEAGNEWKQQRENGGDWLDYRHHAKKQLECYMHEHSGDVATRMQWEDDFKNMDVESWFGKPFYECEELHWLDDAHFLIEVEYDIENNEWVEA